MAENTEQQGREEELKQAQEASVEVDAEENGEATSEETSGEESVESSQAVEEGSSEENPELLQLKDKYLRTLAEYENFRKRSEKEKAQMFELGAKSIIEALLPVVDNFERALSHVQEEEKDSPFVKGIEGIYKQIQKMFADCNIQEIEALGKKFDPALHNAVMTEEEGDALQLKDKYLRTLAEYENFRKRSEKEKAQMFELGAKSIIEALLPVVDNFERALSHVQEEEKDSPFVKGIEGIYKQIQKMFADCNIQEIEALGKKFDPALHNAVMTEEEGDAEEDTITQDLQKGYTYRGNVVRHSMVKVKK